jgi:hypothetical protein
MGGTKNHKTRPSSPTLSKSAESALNAADAHDDVAQRTHKQLTM